MKALLLAAGRGTRLRPITNSIPKCLVPIHGRPLLAIWLHQVFNAGISTAVINTHYLARQVEDFAAASPWHQRIELMHEETLLGTGGSLLAARDRLGLGAVLVVHADNLTEMDLVAFQEAHARRPAGAVMTMALFQSDSPQTCGIVECDPSGLVTAFHEKVSNPPGNLANAAVYIFEPEVFEILAGLERKIIDLSTEVIPFLLGRIYTYPIRGYHRDIGSPDALETARAEFPVSVLADLSVDW